MKLSQGRYQSWGSHHDTSEPISVSVFSDWVVRGKRSAEAIQMSLVFKAQGKSNLAGPIDCSIGHQESKPVGLGVGRNSIKESFITGISEMAGAKRSNWFFSAAQQGVNCNRTDVKSSGQFADA